MFNITRPSAKLLQKSNKIENYTWVGAYKPTLNRNSECICGSDNFKLELCTFVKNFSQIFNFHIKITERRGRGGGGGVTSLVCFPVWEGGEM